MNRLAMIRGDTKSYTVTLVDADTGDPIDLTGIDVTFTAKYRYWDIDGYISKTVGSGIVVAEPEDGTLVLTLDPADTSELTCATRLIWDIQIHGDEVTRTPLNGTLDVYLDSTL